MFQQIDHKQGKERIVTSGKPSVTTTHLPHSKKKLKQTTFNVLPHNNNHENMNSESWVKMLSDENLRFPSTQRVEEMKPEMKPRVIGVGLPGSGTSSLAAALEILGFGPVLDDDYRGKHFQTSNQNQGAEFFLPKQNLPENSPVSSTLRQSNFASKRVSRKEERKRNMSKRPSVKRKSKVRCSLASKIPTSSSREIRLIASLL